MRLFYRWICGRCLCALRSPIPCSLDVELYLLDTYATLWRPLWCSSCGLFLVLLLYTLAADVVSYLYMLLFGLLR